MAQRGLRRNPSRAVGGAAALCVALLSSSPASALPPASGSKCSSGWVNNQSALNCFIRGEEESRAGARHPHYVACTAAGEVFCCVDDDHGNQNCEAQVGGRTSTGADRLRAILAAHRSLTTRIERDSPRRPGQSRPGSARPR